MREEEEMSEQKKKKKPEPLSVGIDALETQVRALKRAAAKLHVRKPARDEPNE
jgi:hypothetical protein